MNDRVNLRIDLVHATHNVTQRDQLRSRNACDLKLVRLAHVDNLELLATQTSRVELGGRDLLELRVGLRSLVRRHTAKLLVIDQLLDRRVFTTNRTLRILPQFELAELHGPGVKQQQTINQQVFRTENDLDCLVRLNCTHDSRQHTKHTTFSTRRHQAGWRRFGIETPVTRTFLGPEDTRLPFKPEY